MDNNRIFIFGSPNVKIPHKFGEIIGVAIMGPINPKYKPFKALMENVIRLYKDPIKPPIRRPRILEIRIDIKTL